MVRRDAVMSGRSKQERAAAILDAAPLRGLIRRMPSWRGVLVLNYHRIGRQTDSVWNRSLWSATAEGLDEQVAYLARHADILGPDDLAPETLERRGRHVLLTFDDGYRDNFDLALPVLRSRGVRALFFVVTGFMDHGTTAWWDEIAWMIHTAAAGRTVPAGAGVLDDVIRADGDVEPVIQALTARYKELPGHATNAYLDHLGEGLGTGRCPGDPEHWMTWDMAREMQSAGMGIGGHTMTHPLLARLPVDQQRAEVRGCATRLRQELGGRMRWFSYPVGSRSSFTPETQRVVEDEGVELAFSFYGGLGRRTTEHHLDVRRANVGPNRTQSLLQATVGLPGLFARVS